MALFFFFVFTMLLANIPEFVLLVRRVKFFLKLICFRANEDSGSENERYGYCRRDLGQGKQKVQMTYFVFTLKTRYMISHSTRFCFQKSKILLSLMIFNNSNLDLVVFFSKDSCENSEDNRYLGTVSAPRTSMARLQLIHSCHLDGRG